MARLKHIVRKNPEKTLVIFGVLLIVILGIVWRAIFIFHSHPLTSYMNYSDMQNYASESVRYFTPGVQLTPADSLYPPGASLMFGFLYHLFGTWSAVAWLNFCLSSLTILILGAIGWLLYGRNVALIVLVMVSAYIGFVELSGYLLSETPYIFFQLLAFLLLLLGFRSKDKKTTLLWGLAAGAALGWTAAIRPVVLLPSLCVAAALVLIKTNRKNLNVLPLLAGAAAGALPFLVGFTIWCTHLNGQFCAISSNGSETVLQGHYYQGVGNFRFVDSVRNYTFTAGDTTITQLGYNDWVTLPWGPYDQHQNLNLVKVWVKTHPKQAIETSFQHIYNLFRTVPWPSEDTPNDRTRIILSEKLFRVLVLLPAAIYTLSLAIPKWRRKLTSKSSDLLVMAPIAGLFLLVFLTIGNPRYRTPFDGFFMLLAARAYSLIPKAYSQLAPITAKIIRKL